MSVMTGINDPYFREDPGSGLQRINIHQFNLNPGSSDWKPWRTNDGRILPNANSRLDIICDPFDVGGLLQLTTHFDPSVAGKSFGGFGIRAPISPPVSLNDKTFIEFDFYYPKSAFGKYMRLEIWSTSSGGEGEQVDAGFQGHNTRQCYIRGNDLDVNNLNPGWIGFYEGQTWFKKLICVETPVTSGTWEYLNIDIHTETGTKLEGDLLLFGNIRIAKMDPHGRPLLDIVNEKSFSEVTPIKEKYNPDNGYFYVGTTGSGIVDPNTIRGYHYEIFVDENNLKPEIHVGPPDWLNKEFPNFKFKNVRGVTYRNEEGKEWELPTESYLQVRDSGNYKLHGHCLAWYHQAPPWMTQLIPENASMQWDPTGLFYSGGNSSSGPYLKVPKDMARRIYFDHIVYLMRHFMSTDERYRSSKERGVIPFYSFDVINEEIHESRHIHIINENPDAWKTALRHVSWLMAMTDNSYIDLRQHYMYLLFKFAHIAVPNELMAEKYKKGYNNPDIVPGYMKFDNHDHNGSIDAYVSEKPPILVYNEYDIINPSKAKVVYNMVRELNIKWCQDPLYDGRKLIECIGSQGHDFISQDVASRTMQSLDLFVTLINEGLLDSICISELDLKQLDYAPGGGAFAPAVLNEKQADSIGYQYALLFKLYEKYKKYISHVFFWGQYGSGWQQSYLPFDHEQKASQAYYAIMDPDKFIKGHSYLESFFEGEYNKIIA
ncbi:MAG: endo-1,4-beta-xylanase [Treponema sp.]|jgi:GH35 family endo-1,4-beta-xylanase|nr:endo-1,4-beta-xylanase [Treponema sp.]